jgi:hypothetical protein
MNSTGSSKLLRDLPEQQFYVESSLPPGLTLSAYRRSRPRRSSRWERLKRLGGGAGAPAGARA